MAVSEDILRFAVKNVAKHGDTDVFPYPIENHWFHDQEKEVVKLLLEIDKEFYSFLNDYPVHCVKSLSAVGYTGFRGATQIDPVWNVYLLGLVLQIASDIEKARIPTDQNTVFSYRCNLSAENLTIFETDLGWRRFQDASFELSQSFDFVVTTDISDFYSRIYHHRLENALKQCTTNTEVVSRVMILLSRLSIGGVSYGLPVGGNAARILAELLLNRTDLLLKTYGAINGVKFCRFVDDYNMFARTREQAQAGLVYLSEVLLNNEGLTLSRSKTRLMSTAEFRRNASIFGETSADLGAAGAARRFVDLRLRYDPYSPNAEEDYERLSEQLRQFDVLSILSQELRKSRIDERVVRQLIKSMKFLEIKTCEAAIVSIVENLTLLYPVFPTIVMMLKGVIDDVSQEVRDKVFLVFRELFAKNSHIIMVSANLAFALRILALDRSEETTVLFSQLYQSSSSDMMIKRDILLAMSRRRADYWLSDVLKKYSVLSPWEQRSLIVASYLLSDEGSHWRKRVEAQLSKIDAAFMHWLKEKNNGRFWEVPL